MALIAIFLCANNATSQTLKLSQDNRKSDSQINVGLNYGQDLFLVGYSAVALKALQIPYVNLELKTAYQGFHFQPRMYFFTGTRLSVGKTFRIEEQIETEFDQFLVLNESFYRFELEQEIVRIRLDSTHYSTFTTQVRVWHNEGMLVYSAQANWHLCVQFGPRVGMGIHVGYGRLTVLNDELSFGKEYSNLIEAGVNLQIRVKKPLLLSLEFDGGISNTRFSAGLIYKIK